MREKARDRGRLEDIIRHAGNIEKMIAGVSFDRFEEDLLIYFAVMKNVEIVGEAAYMLSNDFKNAHPETPWKVIQGMRHYLVHGYANIDKHELYNTALNDIPALCEQARYYLSKCNWDEWEKE